MKMKGPKEKAHVIKNTAFIFKLAAECSPFLLFILCFDYILVNVYESVIMGVYFLKTALLIIEQQLDFKAFFITVSLIVLGKAAIGLLDKFVDYYISFRFAIKFEKKINSLIFNKAEQVELACYDDPVFYDRFTRASWVIDKYANTGIIHRVAWVAGNALSVALLVAYLISLDPVMSLFIAAPILVTVFRSLRNKEQFKKEKDMTVFERRKDYIKRTVLLKNYAKDMKTSNIFTVLKRYLTDAVNENIKIIKKYGIKITLYELAGDLFGSVIPVGGGFGYSCYRLAVMQNIGISDFSVFITSILAIKNKLDGFAEFITRMQQQCFWVQALRDFLAYEPKIKGGSVTADEFKSLEFKNVSFCYPNSDKKIMNNVSFKINKGDTIAIVGHNGAGKTTFSKLLMRLYDVSEGEILYNGINIKDYTLDSYRKKFACVFQDYKLFAMTAAENVLTADVTPNNFEIAKKAIDLSGAGEKFRSLKNGINSVLTKEFDDEGISLSGGEAQKLAIAKLFAREYDIAVLDEPSSALDPIAETEMYKSLKTGTVGKTVIFISHRLSSVTDADTILVFSNGEITESGSHEVLMNNNGEYRKMFDLQASGYREEGHGFEE